MLYQISLPRCARRVILSAQLRAKDLPLILRAQRVF